MDVLRDGSSGALGLAVADVLRPGGAASGSPALVVRVPTEGSVPALVALLGFCCGVSHESIVQYMQVRVECGSRILDPARQFSAGISPL